MIKNNEIKMKEKIDLSEMKNYFKKTIYLDFSIYFWQPL
jgi:hypothetical protein